MVPDVEPGPILSGSFVSEHRLGETTGWSLMRPPDTRGQRLPLVVSLHALGWDHEDALSRVIGLPQFLAQAVDRGVPPFAIAAVDGGRGYWHRHPSGDDAEAMVVDELLPRLRPARRRRPTGSGCWAGRWAGTASLRLATDLGPERVAAVVAASPACGATPRTRGPTGSRTRRSTSSTR